MLIGKDIIKVAKTYIGTPFHHLGRVKNHGIDCVGIILCIAKELNIPLVIHSDFERYGRRTRQRSLLEYMDEQFIRLKTKQLGAILVSWYNERTKEPSHLGIVTDIGIIHTSGGLGVVMEEYWSVKWDEQVIAYYKYPGVK